MHDFNGLSIYEVANFDEINRAIPNEDGTVSVYSYRNIVNSMYWIEGESSVCFVVEAGKIREQLVLISEEDELF